MINFTLQNNFSPPFIHKSVSIRYKARDSKIECVLKRTLPPHPFCFRLAIEADDPRMGRQMIQRGVPVRIPTLRPGGGGITIKELLTVLSQDCDYKIACKMHSLRILPLVTPSRLYIRIVPTYESMTSLFFVGENIEVCVNPTSEHVKKMGKIVEVPAEILNMPSEFKKFKLMGPDRDALKFVEQWFGPVVDGEWSKKEFYDSWYGKQFISSILGICGFAHPSAIACVANALENAGIKKGIDLCAGTGFVSFLLHKFGSLEMEAYDLLPDLPTTMLGAYFPVTGSTNAFTFNYQQDWKHTVLVLSWPDDPHFPLEKRPSFAIVTAAYAAGNQYLLLLGERYGTTVDFRTQEFLAQHYEPEQRHFLHIGGEPFGSYSTMELYKRKAHSGE